MALDFSAKGAGRWPLRAHAFVLVELYLRSSYDPDAEYVDGEIEERLMDDTTTLPGKAQS